MQCVAFCCLLWHVTWMLLPYGPTLLFFFFFFCLMIYKRSTQNTNLYTCGTIIIQHVGKLCDLESVIIL
ncbi:unnamed protein product [Brassica napus]|uniref:(rape) hypothetical protein n=1 Tax=Brassica napus TaxID=3708 RepID=A0A816N1L9_BRANA|nr:unnamed protein product [Brassica napus]